MKRGAAVIADDVIPPAEAAPAFVLQRSECYSTVVSSVTATIGGTVGDEFSHIDATATRDSNEFVRLEFSSSASTPDDPRHWGKINVPLALFPHLASLLNELYWRSAEARLVEERAPWYDSTREFDVNADIIAVKP